MYRHLKPDFIVKTTDILRQRIRERFPQRGLALVCDELYTVSREASEKAEWMARPLWPIRIVVTTFIIALFYIIFNALFRLEMDSSNVTFVEIIQAIESGINDIILIGAAIFFLATIERRIKRDRALKALHELRALAHVIDMHQLPKDPERIIQFAPTASSPKEEMTPFELTRYLDYCSEMLSIIGKIAALYVQDFDDPIVLGAVNEIETLSNGLARKIWQKIVTLQSLLPENRQPSIRTMLQPQDTVA
ncbi:MAG: hypothetical protein KA314_01615 [Chloroflexi bacterium]|nr:hypothetical protein [Chloroflexota bacterium]MBP8054505.1 hypothetical protein [Chloroflexota bacterium]